MTRLGFWRPVLSLEVSTVAQSPPDRFKDSNLFLDPFKSLKGYEAALKIKD